MEGFYYLRKFDSKRALLSNVAMRNSIEADVSYDYTLEYLDDGKHFSLIHVANSDLGYQKGGSVTIRVSRVNKNYATFKSYKQQLRNVLLMIVVIILVIVFWIKVILVFLGNSELKFSD